MMFWKAPEYKIYEPQTFKETVTTITYTPQFKELTDEEIIEIRKESTSFGYKDWSDTLSFARAILRKAQK